MSCAARQWRQSLLCLFIGGRGLAGTAMRGRTPAYDAAAEASAMGCCSATGCGRRGGCHAAGAGALRRR